MIQSATTRYFIYLSFSIYLIRQVLVLNPVLGSLLTPISSFFGFLFLACCLTRYLINLIPNPKVDPGNKAVLITGAASGFGRSMTIDLDNLGFTVFAGVRKVDNDPRIDEVRNICSSKVQFVQLDVTSDQDIDNAVISVSKILQEKNLVLWSVVNNAGVMKLFEIIRGQKADHELEMMNTNVLGVAKLNKAFVPLLAKSRNSRIILVSSIAARHVYPPMTAYCMSKFAMRAYGDGLRRELRRLHIHVSMIEPSDYETPLTDADHLFKKLEDIHSSSPDAIRKLCDGVEDNMTMSILKSLTMKMRKRDSTPVIQALVKVVSVSSEPQHCIATIDWFETILLHLGHILPMEVIDMFLMTPGLRFMAKIWPQNE